MKISNTEKGYTESYVAFLDILGFKNLVNTSGFDDVLDVFKKLTEGKEAKQALYRACFETDSLLVRYNQALEDTGITIMSDSIIVVTPCESPESLSALIDTCKIIQYYLYDCCPPILLRGAIAKGDMYQNEDMLFGKAMIDAYLAQETISQYPRIILSQNLMRDFVDIPILFGEKSQVILDEDQYYHINCLGEYLDTGENEELFAARCTVFKHYIQENLATYVDNSVREKMLWLKNEFESIATCICREKGFSDIS